MNNIVNNSYIYVDLAQLRANARAIMGELPAGTAMIPVLKGDAYGLGLGEIARALTELPEIKMLAISHVSEGVRLRESGYTGEVLVLGGTVGFLLPQVVEHSLTLTIGRLGLVPELAKIAREQGKTAKVQLKVETGLHRIGLMPGQELAALAAELKEAGEQIVVTGAFTHFADLEDPGRTISQYDAFLNGVEQLESLGIHIPMRHVSGSAATELCPQFHLDAVRIGRRLYMDHPTKPRGNIGEVASWRTFITNIRTLKAGEQLGYGGNCALEKDTEVAVIGVGYGDGLNEALAACHAPVLVNGQQARLLACCMDQSMIDVTGIDCAPDDEVTFFGYDSQGNYLSSQEVSLLIGDNEGCGLYSDLSGRVARVYG